MHYTAKIADVIPTIQRVTVYGSSVVQVEWDLPYTIEARIGFIIYAISTSRGTAKEEVLGDDKTIGNITNLKPSTNYTITVAPVFFGNLEGNMSQPITIRTEDDITSSGS